MAELATAERDAILRQLFGGTLYMGLARSTPEDEETDAGYKRRPVTLSEPQGDDVRFVTNPEPVLFPEYQRDAERPVQFAFLSDTPEGPAKWSDRLREPMTMRAGGIIFFGAGQFRIGVP